MVALPFLESLGVHNSAFAAVTKTALKTSAPKRMVFLGIGYGVTKESWYPDVKSVGAKYALPKGLKPLVKHQEDITVIQNLQHQFSKDGHFGSTFWLTGANKYAVPGQGFHNSVSVDQVAAEVLGKQTRFTSIQMSCKDKSGHGPGSSLAWNRYGKPVAGLNTPVAAYHRLFSDDKTPMEVRQDQLTKQKSVLDTVLSDAKSVGKKINKTDANKLDEYFQSVREIEVRLEKEEGWLGTEKQQPDKPVKAPKESLQGVEEIRVMYDLMVAAMQVDATRVFTYRMPNDRMVASLGGGMSAHSMSHYSQAQSERMKVSEQRDEAHAKLLAEFFDKLKASKDADGSSLFDNVAISMGSNISTLHSLHNCPTLIAGGGAGIKQGRHLVMRDKETPLCNLWLSLLQGVGVRAESHGDSTGVIEELFS